MSDKCPKCGADMTFEMVHPREGGKPFTVKYKHGIDLELCLRTQLTKALERIKELKQELSTVLAEGDAFKSQNTQLRRELARLQGIAAGEGEGS